MLILVKVTSDTISYLDYTTKVTCIRALGIKTKCRFKYVTTTIIHNHIYDSQKVHLKYFTRHASLALRWMLLRLSRDGYYF